MCTRMRCAQVKIVNRKCVREGSTVLSTLSEVENVHEINLEPDLGLFGVCFCIEESTPLLRLFGRA